MIVLLLAGILGLCWGSFLNVVAVRLLNSRSLWHNSRCCSCGERIAWYDLVPLFSWIVLGGNCRSCAAPISGWYPALEIITALSIIVLRETHTSLPDTIIRGFLASCCIITFRTDGEHQLLVIPVMRAIALGGIMAGFLDPYGFSAGLLSRFIGATIGFGALWALGYLYTKIRGRIGIGEGDAELLGSLGMAVGPIGICMVLLCAPLIGTLHIIYLALTRSVSSTTPVPFGAYCALVALIELVTHGALSSCIILA